MKMKSALVALLLGVFAQQVKAQQVVINEVITSNSTVIVDDDGSFEDWVELYNRSNETVSLAGYGLTDNSNLFQWVFPDIDLQPGQHLLVWCSDKNRQDPSAPLHTNFKISSAGETISLTAPNGQLIDQIPAVVIAQNTSYGRLPDGADHFQIFAQPTPGTVNTSSPIENPTESVAPPIFSHPSGFYTEDFSLTLSHPNPEAIILYTLDGSDPREDRIDGDVYSYKTKYRELPTQTDGQLVENTLWTYAYEEAIPIIDRTNEPNRIAAIPTSYSNSPYIPSNPVFKGTVVRAIAIVNGEASPVITHNYYVTPAGADRYNLPVISLNVDEKIYYSYENGLNVAGSKFDQWRADHPDEIATWESDANYWFSGSESEIRLNVNIIQNGQSVLNHDAGLRNHGNGSRYIPNRSVRLYAKGSYGSDYFQHQIFPNYSHGQFKRLILRNSGNDAYRTFYRDAYVQQLTKHLNFSIQQYQPAVVFLNAEFNGLYNIRERFDEYYFKRVYGIEPSELDFLENNGLVDTGDDVAFWAMLSYANTEDLSNAAKFAHLTTMLDPENYTDYFITNIFIGNTDWPYNNNEYFRKRVPYTPNAPYGQDGRFRWVLKDTDLSYDYSNTQSYTHNHLEDATRTWESDHTYDFWNSSNLLIRKMLNNLEYRNYFINRFADLLNTTFLTERSIELIDSMRDTIAAVATEHIARWNMVGTIANWEQNINVMREYATQRPAYQREHILAKFNIEGTYELEVDVNNPTQGYVAINTIDITSDTPGVAAEPYPWTGVYFQMVPIKVKAIALAGYQFSHWSGASDSTEEEIELVVSDDIQLVAHFVPASIPAALLPIYYWVFDSNVANDTPLQQLTTTFTKLEPALLTFESCLEGYPYTSTHSNWRKASLERRNSPTEINYVAAANLNKTFDQANMRGLQIKQPFEADGRNNQLILNIPTTGYENIKVQLAIKDEDAADAMVVEYQFAEGDTQWYTTDLPQSEFELTDYYQLIEVDFSGIQSANNNPNFKVRCRFIGEDMTADEGNRVTFNNLSVTGDMLMQVGDLETEIMCVYPNPFTNTIYFHNAPSDVSYIIYSIEGRLIQQGSITDNHIELSHFTNGMYILHVKSPQGQQTYKIIKK